MDSSSTSSNTSIGSSILNTLNAGSGINAAALAEELTNAQRLPQQNLIQRNIDQTEAAISGYALISYQLSVLQTGFEGINDANELASGSGSSADSSKVSILSVSGDTPEGTYDLLVNQLAQNQRVMSHQYAGADTSINSGNGFDLTFSLGSTKAGTFEEHLTKDQLRAAVASGGSITVTNGDGASITVTQADINAAGGTTAGSELLSGYVAALEAADIAGTLGFNAQHESGTGVSFTQTAPGTGSIVSASGSITSGIPSITPVTGVAAVYSSSLTASQTTTLTVSDGLTTVSVDSASYSSVAEQVTAIQSSAGYSELLFTVSENAGGIEFTYKTTSAVVIAPTLTTTAGSQTLTNDIVGISPVNAPVTSTLQITPGADTPAAIAAAINDANIGGITASLVDTGTSGSNYRIVLSGAEGADNSFSVTSIPDLGFRDTANVLQSAQNAELALNGVSITRGSNQISDVINGAVLSLNLVNNSAVSLTFSRDTARLKDSIIGLVDNFNAFNNMLDSLTEAPSEDVELSGALAEDKTLARYLSDQLRTAILTDSSTSSGSIRAMRDIGVSIDRYGQLTFDEKIFDNAVANSYADVVTMLTANTSDESLATNTNKGLSQDLATLIEGFTDSGGVVINHSSSANTALADYEQDLADLEVRMDAIYTRYITQFAAMESLIASINNTKSYLTTQLENMADTYWKN